MLNVFRAAHQPWNAKPGVRGPVGGKGRYDIEPVDQKKIPKTGSV